MHNWSYLYFFNFWLSEVAHIGSRFLIHERSILSIGFRNAYLVRNVWVGSLLCGSLGCKGRIILLYHLFLHSEFSFFLISLLISHHFQILNLSFRRRRQSFFHSRFRTIIHFLQLFFLILILDNISLTHRQFRDSRLHLPGEISQSTLKLVDLFRNLQCRLPSINCIFLQFLW